MCNVDAYNNLPDDLKAAFDASYDRSETSLELNSKWQAWHDINAERLEKFHIDRGDPPPFRLSDEEADQWNEMVRPVIDEWIERTEAKGFPAGDLWEAFLQHASDTKAEIQAHLDEVLPGYIEEERPRIEG
jgi:hypothetical protein